MQKRPLLPVGRLLHYAPTRSRPRKGSFGQHARDTNKKDIMSLVAAACTDEWNLAAFGQPLAAFLSAQVSPARRHRCQVAQMLTCSDRCNRSHEPRWLTAFGVSDLRRKHFQDPAFQKIWPRPPSDSSTLRNSPIGRTSHSLLARKTSHGVVRNAQSICS